MQYWEPRKGSSKLLSGYSHLNLFSTHFLRPSYLYYRKWSLIGQLHTSYILNSLPAREHARPWARASLVRASLSIQFQRQEHHSGQAGPSRLCCRGKGLEGSGGEQSRTLSASGRGHGA